MNRLPPGLFRRLLFGRFGACNSLGFLAACRAFSDVISALAVSHNTPYWPLLVNFQALLSRRRRKGRIETQWIWTRLALRGINSKAVPYMAARSLLCGKAVDGPYRILTVDDEVSVNLSLQFVFPKSHYEVVCVASGAAALANLEANSKPYDVIIIDQRMPNLTGVELVEAIRERGIPGEIIILSAHLTSEARQAYARLGVNTVFPKPFEVERLRSTVDRLVGRGGE